MAMVEANGVTLGVEHFGDAAAPLVLLTGGTTMLARLLVLEEAATAIPDAAAGELAAAMLALSPSCL